MAFPSVSASLFVPAFSFDRRVFGLIFFEVAGGHSYRLDMVSTGPVSPLLVIWAKVLPFGSLETLESLPPRTF